MEETKETPAVIPGPVMTLPTVGRMVHYISRGSADGVFKSVPRAAVITQINEDGTVGLCVLNPEGMYFNQSVPKRTADEVGVWDWMPFQKDQASRMAPGTMNDSHPRVGGGMNPGIAS